MTTIYVSQNDELPRRSRPAVISGSDRKPSENTGGFQGLGPMARVSTSFGDMHAQTLRERDMLRTRAGGFIKIERVDRYVLDEDFLSYHPEALPVRIRAGAFGRNLPASDVILAPYQKFTAGQQIAGSTLSRALDALGRPSVVRAAESFITYTVIRCAKPVSILCEGLWIDI